MAGFIGSGDLRINRKDPASGLFQGWTKKLYANRFELQAAAEVRELTSKGKDDYGVVIGSVALQQPATFSLTLRDPDKDAMTLLFLGSQAALTQAGSTVTAEAVSTSGGDIRTSKGNISAVTLTSSPAGTTYVLNTDYRVGSASLGILEVVPGSDLADDIEAAAPASLPLLASYTAGTISGTTILGSTQPSIRAAVNFDGKNQESGRLVQIDIWEAVLTPDSGFDFLGDDWAEIPLSGRMVKPLDKASPFVINLLG